MAKNSKQPGLNYGENDTTATGPVECLGQTFPNDEARRAHFTELLRKKLKDPAFRKIDGFPIGEDEDILELSDPPYYTACPNPFLMDLLAASQLSSPDDYHRPPFATDVAEGSNDPIYNAHTYHTKVPPKAIMRYILHYTQPGDVVFDGFAGTGMTGVAAHLCDDKDTVAELGYTVTKEGVIRDAEGNHISALGTRRCILNELSPAATLIERGYNTSFRDTHFADVASTILHNCEQELNTLFATSHNAKDMGTVDFVVYSDTFTCDNCGKPIVLWSAVIDQDTRHRTSRTDVPCSHCKHVGDIRRMSRVLESYPDQSLGIVSKRVRQEPVLIQYRYSGSKHEKTPDKQDRQIVLQCDEAIKHFSKWYPAIPMPEGLRKAKDAYHLRGITHTHHFYTSRNLIAFSTLWDAISQYHGVLGHQLRFWAQSVALGFTRLNRYFESSYSQVNRYMKGTFYVAPFISEVRLGYALNGKINKLAALNYAKEGTCFISTNSSTSLQIPDSSIDYIFVDPPFGRNIQYSELNFLWESWLKVRTNAKREAIVDETIGKERNEYHFLMRECFTEFHRILKPGRWMTVEFHNAENAIWNIIQEALLEAGFVVADVRVLDKKNITMQQWVGTNVVSKDLVISVYKPTVAIETIIRTAAGSESAAWDFTTNHLQQLPVFVKKGFDRAEVLAERQSYLLYDRMVAFHVQRGISVPLSAAEFYAGLLQRYAERDGMYFLPEQTAEYDKKRMAIAAIEQLELFVSNEASAIQWLKQKLSIKPQPFTDIQPEFMQEVSGWQKHEQRPELLMLLEESFLCYDGIGEVPNQIHSYLSTNFHDLRNLSKGDSRLIAKAKGRWYVPDPRKEADLEKMRHRHLMKEFESYREAKGKLKVVRTEALRAGFKECWQHQDYKSIVHMATKIADSVIEADSTLLMYYDNALMRAGE
jgi:DNA modification methylase